MGCTAIAPGRPGARAGTLRIRYVACKRRFTLCKARFTIALALAALGAPGCADIANRGVAARVGDWTLTEARLAELIVLAQPFPLDSLAAHQLADHWVTAAALSQRSAAGDSLLGSEAFAEATWLERREAILDADREARLGPEVTLDAASAGEIFARGELRLVAHVLRRVGPETSSSERVLQQRTAERLLTTLVEGGTWDQVLAESEDAETQSAGGLMGLFGPGELPSTLDRAVFQLGPGQVSSVVQSARGFHIVYRPRYDEIGSLYRERLRRRMLAESDAAANARELAARGFEVAPGGTAILGRMAEDPGDWLESAQPLATWEGGALTAGVAARYLGFFPPESLGELAGAPEDARADLIAELGTRELRYGDAVARGEALSPSLEEAFASAHADEIEYWTGALELDAPDAPSRAALARHMELLVSRQLDARSPPPLLVEWLRGRIDHTVRTRGVLAAIVQARGMLTEAGTGGAGS